MKSLKTYLVFFFLFLMTNTMADNAFKKLDDFLSTFRSMSADFQQRIIAKKNVGKSSSGTMALERPGKFRWETLAPNHQIIIADGQYLWFYDVDLEQATKQNIRKDANSPAILLSGSTQALEQRFKIIDSYARGNESCFRLTPHQDHDMVKEVELRFMGDKLHQMTVVDNLGQKTVFDFSNVQLNPTLSKSLFHFKPPKGVDIIKQ